MSEIKLIHVVPELDDRTVLIAEKLHLGYQEEVCYPYRYFADDGVSMEEAKAFIQALKRVGIVKVYHGLLDQDGNVAGSGFALNGIEASHLMELALYRFNYADRPFGTSSDYAPKQIVIGDFKYRLVTQEAGDGK